MSNMDEVLSEPETNQTIQQSDIAKNKNKAEMFKALNKRLKLSQKISDDINAYCSDQNASIGIKSTNFITIYANLSKEQKELKDQIASLL